MRCAIRSADIAENMNPLRIRMWQSVIHDHVMQFPYSKKTFRDTFVYVKIIKNINNHFAFVRKIQHFHSFNE